MVRSELQEAPHAAVGEAATRIVALTAADIGGGLALSDAAGWNQTAEDWALVIGSGRGVGIRAADGRLIATAASLGYGRCAWISLVLVDAAARHRGLASALMARCIERVQAGGESAVLDATPAGAAVYGRLGFAAGFAFARWEGPSGARPGPGTGAGASGADAAALLDRIAALDSAVSLLDRRAVLASFLARPATRVWMADDNAGFAIARAGRRAWHIGPIVAADEAQGAGLLRTALEGLPAAAGDRVIVDLPDAHATLAHTLAQRGFAVQRPFVRMALGDATASRLPPRSFALGGPEYG